MNAPALRILSLGTGVQSTTCLLLAVEGHLPRLDYAIFSDTGWEPQASRSGLDCPAHSKARVSRADDALGQCPHLCPDGLHVAPRRHRLIPGVERLQHEPDLFRVAAGPPQTPQRSRTVLRQQTSTDHLTSDIAGNNPGRLRRVDRLHAEFGERLPNQWHRIGEEQAGGRFARQLNNGRGLHSGYKQVAGQPDRLAGLQKTQEQVGVQPPKSFTQPIRQVVHATIKAPDRRDRYRIFASTCPFHGNAQWRALRDQSPEEWADVVAFDAAIRSGNARANAEGSPLLGQAFLYRSLLPLSIAPIDRVTAHEWNSRQGDVFDAVADAETESGDPDGCSPWACRSGSPTRGDFEQAA